MNLYIDVDGVIISQNNQLSNFAEDFLNFITTNWSDSTYWLTSYGWRGQDNVYKIIRPLIKDMRLLQQLKVIKVANWSEYKTDGIDFKTPFLWFDDNLSTEEEKILKHYGALDCHRMISLHKDPNQLIDEINYLKTLI